jgi:hypothetical protein
MNFNAVFVLTVLFKTILSHILIYDIGFVIKKIWTFLQSALQDEVPEPTVEI